MNDILGMPVTDSLGGGHGLRAPPVPPDPDATAATGSGEPPRSPRPVAMRILAFVAVGVVCYHAKAIVLPVVAALILSFLLRPPVRLLKRMRVPNAIGALLVVGGILAIGAFAVIELSGPAGQWVDRLPKSMGLVKERIGAWRHPVDQVNAMAQQVNDLTSRSGADGAAQVEARGESWSSMLLSNAQETVALTGMTVILLFFLLAAGDGFLSRIVQSFPRNHRSSGGTELVLGQRPKQDSARLLHETEHQIASYLWTVSLINLGFGLAVGLSMHLLGLPNAVLWGVLSAALNFVPFIGNIVGIGLVSLVSVISFEETFRVAAPPLVFMVLVLFESNVVTPYVLGRRFSLSPIVIIIWTLVCTWMWGIAGAFIAVPTLAFVKILCERIESFAPLARAIEP